MNIEIQNSEDSLNKLAAQREMYRKAKQLFVAQSIVSGPFACILIIIGLAYANTKSYIAIWSVGYLFIEILIISPYQKMIRKDAAKIQEAFDTELFSMEWNSVCCGTMPKKELIIQYSGEHKNLDPNFEKLQNWYPKAIAELPNNAATLICQRTNCWWDGDQRKKYSLMSLVALISSIAIGAITSLTLNLSAQDAILSIALPLLPMLKLLITQFIDQRDAAVRLEHLHQEQEKIWSKLLKVQDEKTLSQELRSLQNEIFNSRSRNQPVIDVIYNFFKDSRECEMNATAEQLIFEYKKAKGYT